MSLFQPSVLKKYLSQQDTALVQKAYKKYAKYFHNAVIQENIRNSKEEQFQEGFLRELFVDILGYTLNPAPSFNLTTELKNIKGAKKVDGAILKDGNALAVIELKGTNTKDLETIRQQAFDYKANQTGCIYVITSNFEKLRFYINNAVDYEEFNLFTLTLVEFEIFYLCLSKENILANKPLSIKEASIVEEENITKKFYGDYSVFKRELYRDLVKQNRSNILLNDLPEKTTKLILFQKSQKLIDRFLFILFAEDRGLLAPNSINTVLKEWKALADLDVEMPLYDRYKQYFGYLDTGRKGTDKKEEIFAYNGGLFQPDSILDAVIIDNDLLYRHTLKLSTYDFESQVDVNILGHIFEHSLNEIESVNAEIEGTDFDKQKTKRKKDGVFYTPKYITKYIVDNTIGKLCTEKKQELGIIDEEYAKGRKNRQATTIIKLDQQLKDYREWLLQLTICDPACGSGAFLNQALDFLIKEHAYLDELNKQLFGGFFVFPDIENQILEHNIYGVDLNEESIEIAKLSLWLRTAQPKRKLTSLNNNIKCGNSLIDSKAVAGDKAFNWKEQFPEVFATGGFDVIIGNPPYVKEATNKNAFSGLHNHPCYQGKMDLWYFFGWLGLNIAKEKSGLVAYIAPNNWITNDGASIFRNKILKDSKLIEFIDFGDFKVFESAGIQTMIYIMVRSIENDNYTFNYSKITNKQLTINDIQDFLLKNNSGKSQIYKARIKKEILINNILNFPDETNEVILNKIESIGNFNLTKDEIFSGIDIGQDFVNAKSQSTLGNNFNIGDGVFNLSEDEYNSYNFSDEEKQLIRPFYTTKEINRHFSNNKNNFWVIYTSSKFRDKSAILPYPNLKNHLDKFQAIITSDNKPYGLHRTRNEKIFKGEKILSIRKCQIPSFSYVNFDSYINRTFNIIQTDRISLRYLTAILNSRLIKFWLKEKGKLQGELFQVDINPIISIPLVKDVDYSSFEEKTNKMLSFNEELQGINNKFIKYFSGQQSIEKVTKKLENWHELTFADFITELNKAIKTAGQTPLTKKDEFEWLDLFEENKSKAQSLKSQIETTEKAIDKMVYELYGLSEEEIKIVEKN
jgi:type I restriction-modification system DNA methylase subunit